jgi:Antibiotic biosynthesis monooxygenase
VHAVVVTVNVEPGHEQEGVDYVNSTVVPLVKQGPGFISGYWLAMKEGQGLSVLLFESAEAAEGAAGMAKQAPTPPFSTIAAVDVREVVAQA